MHKEEGAVHRGAGAVHRKEGAVHRREGAVHRGKGAVHRKEVAVHSIFNMFKSPNHVFLEKVLEKDRVLIRDPQHIREL